MFCFNDFKPEQAELELQLHGSLEWISWCCMIIIYRIENTLENTLELMYFPCVQQIQFYFRAISVCLESKYKPTKHQYNIDTVVNFLRFFSDYLETILSLERFWETYSEAVPRVMNILFLLTLIYLKIINSGYCLDILPNSQKKDHITWGN